MQTFGITALNRLLLSIGLAQRAFRARERALLLVAHSLRFLSRIGVEFAATKLLQKFLHSIRKRILENGAMILAKALSEDGPAHFVEGDVFIDTHPPLGHVERSRIVWRVAHERHRLRLELEGFSPRRHW